MNRKQRKLKYIRAKNKSRVINHKIRKTDTITSLDFPFFGLPETTTIQEVWKKGFPKSWVIVHSASCC